MKQAAHQKAIICKAGAFEYLYRLLYAFSHDPQARQPGLVITALGIPFYLYFKRKRSR